MSHAGDDDDGSIGCVPDIGHGSEPCRHGDGPVDVRVAEHFTPDPHPGHVPFVDRLGWIVAHDRSFSRSAARCPLIA
jgi:hypothetical protein